MANTTSVQRLISIRDKMLDAVEKLAGEGVTSYTIGDQSYTLVDVDRLLRSIENLDKMIAVKSRTFGGRNRIDLRKFNG